MIALYSRDCRTVGEHLAYLEKQKEQKPAEWSKEDEANFAWFDKFFRAESVVANGRDIPQDKYLWFKSLHPQPKVEWSEEDTLMQTVIIQTLERFGRRGTTGMQIDWLKSLPERFNLQPKPAEMCYGPKGDPDPAGVWKPSEEQIRIYEDAISCIPDFYKPKSTLKTLLEQLKKL